MKVKINIVNMEENKEQDQSDLEKYIVANQPQTTNDIDRLEEEYNQRRFTGMGRHEYFPVTR